MIFPEKIRGIKSTDRVLEIGPGALPHLRSNVFLELSYNNEEEHTKQNGGQKKIDLHRPVVYYDGGRFPFADNEFDYVICSHVIEHVENIEYFLQEMFRVAKKGYIEYPTILYEYLYNFEVHLNFIKRHENSLFFLKKSKTNLDAFLPLQKYFLTCLDKGYLSIVNENKDYFFEGFEWDKPFKCTETEQIIDLMWKTYSLVPPPSSKYIVIRKVINYLPFNNLLFSLIKKLKK